MEERRKEERARTEVVDEVQDRMAAEWRGTDRYGMLVIDGEVEMQSGGESWSGRNGARLGVAGSSERLVLLAAHTHGSNLGCLPPCS